MFCCIIRRAVVAQVSADFPVCSSPRSMARCSLFVGTDFPWLLHRTGPQDANRWGFCTVLRRPTNKPDCESQDNVTVVISVIVGRFIFPPATKGEYFFHYPTGPNNQILQLCSLFRYSFIWYNDGQLKRGPSSILLNYYSIGDNKIYFQSFYSIIFVNLPSNRECSCSCTFAYVDNWIILTEPEEQYASIVGKRMNIVIIIRKSKFLMFKRCESVYEILCDLCIDRV